MHTHTRAHTHTHTHIHTQVGDPNQVKLVSSALGRATLHLYWDSLGNDDIDFAQSMCQIIN